MKGKNLVILAVLAIVLGALALRVTRKGEESAPDLIGQAVLKNLPTEDIGRMVVRSATATATLQRTESAWVVKERYDYPADFPRIREAVIKLADLKIGQTVDIDPSQRAALKLVPPGEAKGTNAPTGTLVDLYGAGDKKVATLLVGDNRRRKSQAGRDPYGGYGGYPDGQYVSTDGGASAYLIKENLYDLRDTPGEWLDKELLNLNATDVREVTMTGPGRPELRLVRTNEAAASLEVVGLTATEEADVSKVNNICTALNYLRFEDVADPQLSPAQTGMDTGAVYKASTRTGEVYTVRIGNARDGNRYARFECALAAPDASVATNKDAQAARQQLEDRAKAFNRKIGPWTYLIASYKAEAMTTPRSDLVKAKPVETNATATASSTATNAPAAPVPTPAPVVTPAAAAAPAAPVEAPAPTAPAPNANPTAAAPKPEEKK